MGQSCAIRRIRFEADGEHIVLVVPCDVKVFRTCLVMLQVKSCKLQFWYIFGSLHCETMYSLPRL